MTDRRWTSSVLWVVLTCAAIAIVSRARYSADLSAFLPHSPTQSQQLLVDQLRDGIASRLIIMAVAGSHSTGRAQVSTAMARTLRADQRFITISNGDASGLERDRAFLFAHRYVLSEAVSADRFTVQGLHDAIQETIDLLTSPAGLLVKQLLPADPTGEMLQIIDQMSGGRTPPTGEGVWTSPDGGRALLLAQTRALGSDTDAQQAAMQAVRRAYARARDELPASQRAGLTLQMSGPGVFAVAARATIEHEVLRLSLLSTGLIVALLLAVYRSVPALLLGLVPVVSGALAGVAAVALGFGVVHGITLGFGVTLIGESVDYSIYLFIQSRADGCSAWGRPLWTTIGLGVLTSICGFAALLPSGFPGLAQLGLYSICGLVAAALVTRFVLPQWLPERLTIRNLAPLGATAGRVLRPRRGVGMTLAVLAAAAALLVYLHRNDIWNRELAALSPVSLADQELDARLRGDIGAPDVRCLVVIRSNDEQTVLRTAERAAPLLRRLVEQHVIGGFDTPARYIPSLQTQRTRLASLPDRAQLQQQLRQALADLPLRAERLEPFMQDVGRARTRAPLRRADLAGTSLASGYDSMLVRNGSQWTGLLPLRAAVSGSNYVDIDIDKVTAALTRDLPGQLIVLDLVGETNALYSSYLAQIVKLSLLGVGAIILLLLIALRSPRRVLRVVAPLALAVLVVIALLLLPGKRLTILHVIGMLLIIAVGSNYALFFDRRAVDAQGNADLTLASLITANATTVVGFGVLATSPVPVLAALGSTVAPGALLALLFAALLSRPPAVAAPGAASYSAAQPCNPPEGG